MHIAALNLAALTPSSARAQKHTAWIYDGGFFVNTSPGRWLESNHVGTFYFSEIGRNDRSAELYDDRRSYIVLLTPNAMYLREGNENPRVRLFPKFTKFYDGRWMIWGGNFNPNNRSVPFDNGTALDPAPG
jgi:hypothetical protein